LHLMLLVLYCVSTSPVLFGWWIFLKRPALVMSIML
jgi:hypothetical protein